MRSRDGTQQLISWLQDDDVLRGLNIPRREWTLDQIKTFITSYDCVKRHLVGIFERRNEALIGFYTLDVNLTHKSAQITAAVCDRSFVGRNVLRETARPFIIHLFETRDIEKVSARVLASNKRIIFNFIIPDLFVYEAKLRQEVIVKDGRREDLLIFACHKSPSS